MGIRFVVSRKPNKEFNQGDVLRNKSNGRLGILLRVHSNENGESLFNVYVKENFYTDTEVLNRYKSPESLSEIEIGWEKVLGASEVQIDIYRKE